MCQDLHTDPQFDPFPLILVLTKQKAAAQTGRHERLYKLQINYRDQNYEQ